MSLQWLIPSEDVLSNCLFFSCVRTYCGNLQVVADVHSVHVSLRDGVRTVQISQKAGRLKGAQTQTKAQIYQGGFETTVCLTFMCAGVSPVSS